MPKYLNDKIRKELARLKKGMDNLVNHKKQPLPQFVLQPVRNKKSF